MKKNKIIIYISLFMIFTLNVKAGSFSAKSSDLNPNVGDTIKITVTATSAAGKFSVSTSNSSILSGGESKWIENGSETFTFKANKTGTTSITVTATDASDSNSGEPLTGSKTINITVKEPQKTNTTTQQNNSKPKVKSSINYLTSLSIDGATLSPAFDKNTTDYEITLPNGTTTININAEKESSSSYITGLGEINVSDGINYISVVVTAENGAKKNYNIKATVLEQEPIYINVNEQDMTFIRKTESMPEASEYYIASTTTVGENEIPCYKNEATGVILVSLKDVDGNINLYKYQDGKAEKYEEFSFNSIKINLIEPETPPKDYIKTTITIDEKEITAYTKENEYPLIYAVNLETGETNFYSYDDQEHTFQKYIIKTEEDYSQYYPYIIIGLIGICFVEFIMMITIISAKNKELKKALRKKLNTKTNFEASYEQKNNSIYKDENNITDDLTDQYLSSEEETNIESEPIDNSQYENNNLSEDITNVFNNSMNKKELKRQKKLAKKKHKDDNMYHF